MPYLFLGLIVLALLYGGSRLFLGANPAVLARVLTKAGGLALLGIALALLLTGRIAFALGAAGLGVGLLTGRIGNTGATPSQGGASEVRSATLVMTLDHETGAMDGRVTAGPHEGAALSDLDQAALIEVLRAAGDEDGQRLMEAYLDGRFPGWREDVERDAHNGPGGDGPLTLEEAHEILGLQPGATAQQIREAHRALMKRVHPDFGGSAALAARVNAAKVLLLSHAG